MVVDVERKDQHFVSFPVYYVYDMSIFICLNNISLKKSTK